MFEADLMNYLDVDYALGSRINAMGTSPSNVEKQIQSIKQELLVLSKWSKHNPHPGLKI